MTQPTSQLFTDSCGIISSFSATSAPVCSLPNAGRRSAGKHCSCRTNAGTLSASPTHQVLGMASLEHICRYFLHTLVCLSDCCKSPLILISPCCCIIGCHRGNRTGCLPLHAAGGSSPFGGFRCATICNELRATKALLRSPPMLKRPFHYNFHASRQTENYPHVYTLLPLRLQISTSSTFQAVLLVHRTLCSVKTSSSQQFPICVFCGFRPTCSSHMFTSPKY